MPRYAHSDVLDNGIAYIKANCNKVILTDTYQTTFIAVNGVNKVAEAVLATTDFTIAGVDAAARVLTAALTGKAGGNAIIAVPIGTNMHIAFVDTVNSKVLYVTEESSDQSITLGNPIQFNSNPTYTSGQPTV